MTVYNLTDARVRPLPEHLAELLSVDLGGRAACAGLAPVFDAELPDETAEQREARHHRAIDICVTCPVRAACAAARADLGRDATGVWAGISSSGHHLTYRSSPMATITPITQRDDQEDRRDAARELSALLHPAHVDLDAEIDGLDDGPDAA